MPIKKLSAISGELVDSATALLSAARLVQREGLNPDISKSLHDQAEKLDRLSAMLKDAARPKVC
ncbi:hypothetical protein BOO69_08365 [Sulfitobacter alexandrii]|uniref:Uncharacterized protein n=1 Tax=Sulfitobacter alexandrii TaxID=1917485 RepID=A0A1J0WH20_9RHOB|nr:hypothetical protein [Sulfitobacter alexandrii]APE43430.1 hypothetical protein BOO69_08365 [Sulfitobacter alexandrii]